MSPEHPLRDELVHLDLADRVATITLDSPDNRNALSRQLLMELASRLRVTMQDPEVRAVVLTATGTTFCSGADLREPPGTAVSSGDVTLPQILDAIWHAPKPVLVRLNGHARAGGVGLVAAADMVVAPKRASFAFSEVRIGVAPAVIAVVCTRRMHPRALARYTMTGEAFDAVTAQQVGLVTIAVDDDVLDDTVAQLLDDLRLAEPTALRLTKELLASLPSLSLEQGFAHTEAVSLERFQSPEAAEGMAAFREKRPPAWARPSV